MKWRILLIAIIVLALFLRVFKIGSYPATLYGDEQAFAWNAYSILKTGADEYGTPYPLQFRSFDDYKAPIPVYLLVPFLSVFGLTAFAVRLPVVLFSVLTVAATYGLGRQFFGRKVSLLAAFLLAISPWHVHLSRGYFEAAISLFFFVAGMWAYLFGMSKKPWLFVSMILFAASVYSYFTPRILLLFFLPFLFLWGSAAGEKRKAFAWSFLYGFLLFTIISLPLIGQTVFGKGFSRFSKLTSSNDQKIAQQVNLERATSTLTAPWRTLFHNKALVWMDTVKNNYMEHFSVNFWYLFGDNSLRYFLGRMGMFYLLELPFLLLGIPILYRKRHGFWFFAGWLLLAPVPAALVGRSFAVRSLAMLPAPFFFVAYGIRRLNRNIVWGGIIAVLFALSLGSVLLRYYLEYPQYAATWWGWENKAAIDYAKAREDEYDAIFISDFYTGAPLAFAVYTAYDPEQYRSAIARPVTLADGRRLIKMGKYYFGSLDIDGKRLEEGIIPPRSLYIGRPEEADSDEKINAPDDGRVLFKIHKT